MSKTNWQDPGSSEILSTHISGLQEAVGKIEDAIGLQTVAETNVPLTEVYISDTDRYRIYQAPVGKRNWVASPAPVIKKNGVQITSGFTIDYGGGAIILSPAASSSDTFTADVTRVNSSHSITPASIGAETPSGAQAKADAAEADAKAHTDTHASKTASLSTLGHVKHAVLTTTLTAASWMGTTSPYSQSVTVSGIASTDTPIIDVVMSGTYSTDEARIEAWGYIYRAVTGADSITFYATDKPTVDLPIQIRVVR